MLYPTLNQPIIFIVIIFAGIFSGIIFDFFRILTTLSGGDRYSKHIFDFLAVFFSFIVLFLCNLKFNLGQFRIYVLCVYLISFAFQRFFSKYVWTKLATSWYNVFAKGRKKSEKRKVN